MNSEGILSSQVILIDSTWISDLDLQEMNQSFYIIDEAELVEIGVVRITFCTCYQEKEIQIEWKWHLTGKVNGDRSLIDQETLT